MSDLNTVGREVFKDSAFTLSNVARKAGKKIEPTQAEQKMLKEPGADEGPAPSAQELQEEVTEIAQVVGNGAAKVAKRADVSLAEKLQLALAMVVTAATLATDTSGEDRAKLELQSQVDVRCERSLHFRYSSMSSMSDQRV